MNGLVTAFYHKNWIKVFSSKVSDEDITAVCCEEQDDNFNQIFYAADTANNIFTLDKKGKIVSTALLTPRKGKIHTLVNSGKFVFQVLSSAGSTTYTQGTHKLKKGTFSTQSAKYSVDGDGTFNKIRGTGDFNVMQYNCRNATNAVATLRIKFGKKMKSIRQVFAYSTFDEAYINLIEEGTADKCLEIFCSKDRLIRRINFSSPVKQVMSSRHHQGKFAEDKIYILLWDGSISSVSGNLLEDPQVLNENLDLQIIVKGGEDEDEASNDGEFKGTLSSFKKI